MKIGNFIAGQFSEPTEGHWLKIHNPALGVPFAEVAASTEEDVSLAIEAAEAAWPAWRALRVRERADFLRKIADGLERKSLELAQAESQNTGKPLELAKSVDVPRAIDNFRFFASAIEQFASHSYLDDTTQWHMVSRAPLGVVACISPWNLPLYLFSWKIAPALSAGNTVVGKPSEITPWTAHLLAEVCQEVGLPAGVLNLVHGTGPDAGAPLVRDPRVKAVSFTGGTETGKRIATEIAPQLKKYSAELGGKNPVLVFEDADLDTAVKTSIRSAFANQGQICLCGSRILVHTKVYDAFKERFLSALSNLKVGDPNNADTNIGALISHDHLQKVESYVALAKEEGGEVIAGGARAKVSGRCQEGWFFQPTVIEGLPMACRTNQEEIFGPVCTLAPFDSEEDALAMANQSAFGLAAVVWTQDVDQMHRVMQGLDAGMVWGNCWMARDLRAPFGGNKQSGLGREGGEEALRFFTQSKTMTLNIGGQSDEH